MLTATERSVRGELTVSVPVAEVAPERYASPDWHSLRLFGGGRHARAFADGVEMGDEL